MEIFERLRNIQELYKTELFKLADEWSELRSKFNEEYQIAYKEYKQLNRELLKLKSKTSTKNKFNRPVSAFTSTTQAKFKRMHKLGIYPDEDLLKIENKHRHLKTNKT